MGAMKKIVYSFIYRLRGHIGVNHFNKRGGQEVSADGGSGFKGETTGRLGRIVSMDSYKIDVG